MRRLGACVLLILFVASACEPDKTEKDKIKSLYSVPVSDEGLAFLKDLENLQELSLSDLPITGTGLKELGGLKHLENVSLGYTNINDDGVASFRALNAIKHLAIHGRRDSIRVPAACSDCSLTITYRGMLPASLALRVSVAGRLYRREQH